MRQAGADHRRRLRDRVHEAGAACEQVVRRCVGAAERVGEKRRRRREHHVGRHRGAHEEVDVLALQAGSPERVPRRRKCDVGQRLVVGRDASLADSRALHDPLVGRVDHRRQLVVREHTVGDVDAEPRDADPAPVRDADHGCAS